METITDEKLAEAEPEETLLDFLNDATDKLIVNQEQGFVSARDALILLNATTFASFGGLDEFLYLPLTEFLAISVASEENTRRKILEMRAAEETAKHVEPEPKA